MAQKHPVATIAALRALIYHDDDDLIMVSGTGDRYRFEASSAAADDGNMAIRPTNYDSDGVWIKVSADPAEAGAGYVDSTITAAEVLALNATPITILAAPGAGFANIFEGAVIYKAAGTAYAGVAAGEDLGIKYTDDSGLEVAACEMTGFADQTTAQFRYIEKRVIAQSAGAVSDVVAVANAVLVAHMLVGEITTGDSDFVFRVFYKTIPITL
jgi:hypothetical protein